MTQWYPGAEDLTRAFSDFVNTTCQSNFGDVIELMSKEHRTLQQSMTQVCVLWLQHLADLDEHEYDDRNVASVKLAKELLSGVDSIELQLPLV